MDVSLVSCAKLPEPDPDAAPLAAELSAAGISHRVRAWDDPGVDWSEARLTLLRSTWNYPRQREAFLEWARAVACVSELWNPLPVVRWNSHKRYLLELEQAGVPVAPTELIPQGGNERLGEVMARNGWELAVVKPAVSAASFRTMLVGPDDSEAGERHLSALVAERDVLIQRYLPSVEDYGERALVWIDGELTHAVRKTPRFHGDDESVSDAVSISATEAALAHRAIEMVEGPLLYARIDVAPGPEGDPVLMELELIEPSLFFPQNPAALARYVAAVRRLLDLP